MMSDLPSLLSSISFVEIGHLLSVLAELFAPAETPIMVRATISACAHGFLTLLSIRMMWQALPATGNGLRLVGMGIIAFHQEANLLIAAFENKVRMMLAWLSGKRPEDD